MPSRVPIRGENTRGQTGTEIYAPHCCTLHLGAAALPSGMVEMHTEITLLHLWWTSVQDIKLNTRKMCIFTKASVKLRQAERHDCWSGNKAPPEWCCQ